MKKVIMKKAVHQMETDMESDKQVGYQIKPFHIATTGVKSTFIYIT